MRVFMLGAIPDKPRPRYVIRLYFSHPIKHSSTADEKNCPSPAAKLVDGGVYRLLIVQYVTSCIAHMRMLLYIFFLLLSLTL